MKLSEKIPNVKTEEHETQIRPEIPLIITHLIQCRDIVLEVGSDTDNADERYTASDLNCELFANTAITPPLYPGGFFSWPYFLVHVAKKNLAIIRNGA